MRSIVSEPEGWRHYLRRRHELFRILVATIGILLVAVIMATYLVVRSRDWTRRADAISTIRGAHQEQVRAALKDARGDLTINGWEARPLGKGKYLVSYTFGLPKEQLRALIERQDPYSPIILLPCSPRHGPPPVVVDGSGMLGWRWEVWTDDQIVRLVNDIRAWRERNGLSEISGQCK